MELWKSVYCISINLSERLLQRLFVCMCAHDDEFQSNIIQSNILLIAWKISIAYNKLLYQSKH